MRPFISGLNGKREQGASAAELLVALPSLLMLGLGALQLALWFHARSALNHAVFEAARAGAAANADPSEMDKAFARGITPWLYGANDVAEMEVAALKARLHLTVAKTLGWYKLQLLSPSDESFKDWAVPARDALGKEIDGVVEIPNDNLRTLAKLQEPKSGASGTFQGAFVGANSQQTLIDANTLKIVGHYSIPLSVPIVGPLIASTLRMIEGCMTPSVQVLGATRMQAPTSAGLPSLTKCASYWGIDENGLKGTPRMPVELAVSVRMQSPARRSDLTQSVSGKSSGLANLGPGVVDLPPLSADQAVQATAPRNRPEWETPLPDLASAQPQAPSNVVGPPDSQGTSSESTTTSTSAGLGTGSTAEITVSSGGGASTSSGGISGSSNSPGSTGILSGNSNSPQTGGAVGCPS